MPQEMSFMRSVSITARCAMRYREEKLKDAGISGVQFNYILYICHHPGVAQDELARLLYVNKSNVTRQLSSLEQGGYIRREQDEKDKRALLVYPTDKAEALLPRVRAVQTEWNGILTGDLTADEVECLTKLMSRVRQKATECIDGEWRTGTQEGQEVLP